MSILSSLPAVFGAANAEVQDSLPASLLIWNENMEYFLVNPDSAASSSDLDAPIDLDKVRKCANLLQNEIISSVLHVKSQDNFVEAEETCVEEAIGLVKERNFDQSLIVVLSILLRTAKNLLRWYIQIIVPARNGSFTSLDNPTEALQSQNMVELYVVLMETNSGNYADAERQELARNASLALFYATYSRNANDASVQKSQVFLIDVINFPRVVMKILVQNNRIPFMLSVMRNVQNLVVSVPQASKSFEEETVDFNAQIDKAPWISTNGDDSIDFLSLTEQIMRWLLNQSDPPFPGRTEDRLTDLALEILRIWYAMRAGRKLGSSTAETLLPRIVVDTLRLPDSDGRCYQCILAMVCLLTDSIQSFGDYLASHDVLPSLLNVLDRQVSYVVDECAIGNSAATAVVPALVIVNKYSVGNPATKQLVKALVFPQDAESSFQVKAAEEIKRAAGEGIGTKNMSPLDAPKGTLRWKLIKLLTWTESNTKRVAGELLWTLCDNDPRQFALRTGLGNALPILAAKGFAKLPV
jgi:hypothetical protein